jgi:hypothetical protein
VVSFRKRLRAINNLSNLSNLSYLSPSLVPTTGQQSDVGALAVRFGHAMTSGLVKEMVAAVDEGEPDHAVWEAFQFALAHVCTAMLYCGEKRPEDADRLFEAARRWTRALGDGDPRTLPRNAQQCRKEAWG